MFIKTNKLQYYKYTSPVKLCKNCFFIGPCVFIVKGHTQTKDPDEKRNTRNRFIRPSCKNPRIISKTTIASYRKKKIISMRYT